MFGTLLYLVSVTMLASWCFSGQRPAVRLAAAALMAVGIPVALLSVAARVGLDASPALVLAAHAVSWSWAMSCRMRRRDSAEGSVLPLIFIAGTVALLTSLLGPDPSEIVLVDAWAHLAWSRTLADSIDAYARGFPAFLATLTPFDPLVGAFRCSTFVLHFGITAQFLAFAKDERGVRLAALAALAYLLVPAAGTRFEIPGPELLSAMFLAAMWWVLIATELSLRARNGALGALTLLVILCHVSALQIALFLAIGLALLAGVGGAGWRARIGGLAAMGAGVAGAAVLSPSFLALVIAPDSVPLVAMQAGAVEMIPLRSFVAALGLTLGGLLLVGALGLVRTVRSIALHEFVLGACLVLAALLLVAPIVLVQFDIELPLQLFTGRLLMASALPLALLAAVVLDRGRIEIKGRDVTPALALAVLVLAQVARPVAETWLVGLALLVLACAVLLSLRAPHRAWPALGGVVVLLAMAARLWIWTPEVQPHVRWLQDAPEELTVLTNWPVTNELDALVDLTVIDGLAGRDANLALHRSSFATELHDRLAWCDHDSVDDGSDEVASIEAYLQGRGVSEAYLVVDERFVNAWAAYELQHADGNGATEAPAPTLFSEPPCAVPAQQRLAALHARLLAWPRVEIAFESAGVVIYRVRSTSAG